MNNAVRKTLQTPCIQPRPQGRLNYMHCQISVEMFTPDDALEILCKNDINRALNNDVVRVYNTDMQTGDWSVCPGAICFYENGQLADGQHRLNALIESGHSALFIVMRGLTRKDGFNIDTGRPRKLVDAVRIATGEHMAGNLFSVCRSIKTGTSQHGRNSHAMQYDTIEAYREAGEWVITNGPRGKKLGNGAILGAVGRAYLAGVDRDKLRRFCDVLRTGFAEGTHESSAVAMRNYLLAAQNSSTSALWRDTFLKVQNAIKYFIADKQLTIIKSVKEEIYPLQ